MLARLLPLLLVLLIPSLVAAQSPVVMRGLSPGTYVLTVAQDGSLSLEPARVVTPDGTPPTDPTTPVTQTRQGALQQAQQIDDPAMARLLAVTYSVIVIRAEQGAYSDRGELEAAATAAVDKVLTAHEANAKWQPFRDWVVEELVRLSKRAELKDIPDYIAAYSAVRDGLMDSIPEQMAMLDVMDIIEVIRLVLDEGLTPQTILRILELVLDIFAANGMEVTP